MLRDVIHFGIKKYTPSAHDSDASPADLVEDRLQDDLDARILPGDDHLPGPLEPLPRMDSDGDFVEALLESHREVR